MEGFYDICIMGRETYENIYAKSEDEAKQIAVDNFKNDDLWFDSEEAERATEEDCEIVWFKEV